MNVAATADGCLDSWVLAFFGPSIRGFLVTTFNLPTIKTDFHPSHTEFEARKLAMLVEINPFGHLPALLLHMMAVIPYEWRFIYMGSKASIVRMRTSLPIREYEKSKKLKIIEVPAGFDASDNEGMHRMMTHRRFYEDIVDPAEWFLLFRSDTILCAQSNQTVNDWLEYDWVGAPWSVFGLLFSTSHTRSRFAYLFVAQEARRPLWRQWCAISSADFGREASLALSITSQ